MYLLHMCLGVECGLWVSKVLFTKKIKNPLIKRVLQNNNNNIEYKKI